MPSLSILASFASGILGSPSTRKGLAPRARVAALPLRPSPKPVTLKTATTKGTTPTLKDDKNKAGGGDKKKKSSTKSDDSSKSTKAPPVKTPSPSLGVLVASSSSSSASATTPPPPGPNDVLLTCPHWPGTRYYYGLVEQQEAAFRQACRKSRNAAAATANKNHPSPTPQICPEQQEVAAVVLQAIQKRQGRFLAGTVGIQAWTVLSQGQALAEIMRLLQCRYAQYNHAHYQQPHRRGRGRAPYGYPYPYGPYQSPPVLHIAENMRDYHLSKQQLPPRAPPGHRRPTARRAPHNHGKKRAAAAPVLSSISENVPSDYPQDIGQAPRRAAKKRKSTAGDEDDDGRRKKNKSYNHWKPEEDQALKEAVQRIMTENPRHTEGSSPSTALPGYPPYAPWAPPPGLQQGESSLAASASARIKKCKQWSLVAAALPGRTNKQCQERWHNHLDPNISKAKLTDREREIILAAQGASEKARPKDVAHLLPGRSFTFVRNNWYNLIRKKERRRGSVASEEMATVDATDAAAMEPFFHEQQPQPEQQQY